MLRGLVGHLRHAYAKGAGLLFSTPGIGAPDASFASLALLTAFDNSRGLIAAVIPCGISNSAPSSAGHLELGDLHRHDAAACCLCRPRR